MDRNRVLFTFLVYTLSCLTRAYSEDSPDLRLIKAIGRQIWEEREELLDSALDNLLFTDEEKVYFKGELRQDLEDAPPEERITCAQCRVSQYTSSPYKVNTYR